MDMLFTMTEADLNTEPLVEVFGQMLGTIDAAVLPSRTAEGEHERGEASVEVSLYVKVGQPIDAVEESEYFSVLFQEIDDGTVEPSQLLVGGVTAGVVGRAAVEHVTASVARRVVRYTLLRLVGERIDADDQACLGFLRRGKNG